jgi:hypothetical protein
MTVNLEGHLDQRPKFGGHAKLQLKEETDPRHPEFWKPLMDIGMCSLPLVLSSFKTAATFITPCPQGTS